MSNRMRMSGINSGMDTQSIVEQLVEAKGKKKKDKNKKKNTDETELTRVEDVTVDKRLLYDAESHTADIEKTVCHSYSPEGLGPQSTVRRINFLLRHPLC